MSYHKLGIAKHQVGSPYKLQEEFLEYIDAVATGNKIMAIQELSDLYGCLESEASKYGISVSDLKVMSDLTKSVFISGSRVNEDFLTYLKREGREILTWGLGFIQVKVQDINYNFYHESVDKYSSVNAPHSHQRDFVSEVMKGEITEVLYDVFSGKKEAYCGCGDVMAEPLKLDFKTKSILSHKKGDLYLRKNDEYHSVSGTHGTITKVVKYGEKTNAFIIAERESEMLRHIPELVCWRMIEEVLNA